jgi:hypothetical protein
MSENIKTNERELAGKVAQWFNEHIQRNKYPSFTSASNETGIKVESKTYFGDIVIWENRETNKAYSYLELKPPFGATEDIKRFRKKAIELNVKIAYTWDFQNLNAYKLENNKAILLDSETHNVLTNINDWMRGDVQADIKAYIYKICEELLSLSETGKFKKFKPEKHYFINFIRKTVNALIPVFESFIRKEHRKKANRDKINKYVVEQGIAYPSDEEFYKLIASQRVYGLITKIIFYLTIKRYFKDLPPLEKEDDNDINKTLKTAFYKAGEIDWQAVFLEGPIDELGLPEEAYSTLQELFSQLKIYNFGELPEDVIGELFEEIIDPEQRHNLGQYFTNEDLVDFIIATIVNEADKYYADPTCGSGTFLIRLYSRLKFLKPSLKHEDILEKIWGIDIGKFPAELSTINLFRQQPKNFDNFPRIINKDIFKIRKGEEFEFPPQHAGKNYVKIKIKLPEFYGLVGNFPYIRQELIEKQIKGFKKDLVQLLAEEYVLSYPELFRFKNDITYKLEELKKLSANKQVETIKNLIDKNQLDLKLSGQADIYSYIFLHCSNLLSNDGSFAIVTSNSWLDVAYGSVLKNFFLDHFKIKMIVASWAEPWFEDAAVNTVFTVLERTANREERNSNIVHFVKLKKQLSELIPERDLQLESMKRWQRIDRIVHTIESAKHKANKITDELSSFENENLLVRMIMQEDLMKELHEKSELSKWGKYLRAPDIYFEILEKCKDKLVPLKSVSDVRRGITTGINEFFYLQKIEDNPKTKTVKCKNSRGWTGEVETEYLKKVIKSPKESDSIIINPDRLKNYLFVCNKSKKELKADGHTSALNYIEWGEKQRTKNNMKWTDVPSVQGRKYWWSLGNRRYPEIIYPCGIGDIYKVFDNSIEVFNDKRLYEVYTNGDDSVLALLITTLSSFFTEAESRINLGDGIIDLTVYEVEDLKVLNIKKLNKKGISKINKELAELTKRKIKAILDEIKQKDRIALDTAVLEALGLDPKEYLPKIYKGITQMVRERLELPKMRKKQKKQKIQISYDQVKESVIKECVGDTFKKFPEGFYTIGEIGKEYDDLEFEPYTTSGKPLIYEYFMGHYTLKDEFGQEIFTTKNLSKAEFAILLAKPNTFRLKIPKDEKVAKSIIENYRNYIKQLKEQIELNANQKLHSWSEAEKMTREILDDYGLISET